MIHILSIYVVYIPHTHVYSFPIGILPNLVKPCLYSPPSVCNSSVLCEHLSTDLGEAYFLSSPVEPWKKLKQVFLFTVLLTVLCKTTHSPSICHEDFSATGPLCCFLRVNSVFLGSFYHLVAMLLRILVLFLYLSGIPFSTYLMCSLTSDLHS